jgi:hypothetical protein
MIQTEPLSWGAHVSPAFRARVFSLCDNLGWSEAHASWLMACMAFETGRTFSPTIRNPRSSAVGLIQFMAATAKGLGTSVTQLARLDAVGQLHYVERYLAPFAPRIHDIEDLYMAILWPAAVGKSRYNILWRSGVPAFAANRGLDLDYDGRITKHEAAAKPRALLAEGYRFDHVFRPTAPAARPVPEKKVSEFLL